MEAVALNTAEYLTNEEVEAAIAQLTDAHLVKITASARAYCSDLRAMGVDDLLNEALKRLISGERQAPKESPFFYAVVQIMRSLADQERKRQSKFWLESDNETPVQAVEDTSLTAAINEERLATLNALLGNDDLAIKVATMCALEHSPSEICEELGIKKTTYDTVRKRIRRAILKSQKEVNE